MICPRCQREFGLGIRICPDCDLPLAPESRTDEELVSVLEPPDQMTALAALARLEEHGIRAVAKSEQIVMYDGLAMMMRPKWGKVLVLERDRNRARDILEEFYAAESGYEQDEEDRED